VLQSELEEMKVSYRGVDTWVGGRTAATWMLELR
jgi:hypothetical protein